MKSVGIFLFWWCLATMTSYALSFSVRQDSVAQQASENPWKERQEAVANWKAQLDRFSLSLDSVKATLNWQRSAPDTTTLDSTLRFFATKRSDIRRTQEEIDANRLLWITSRTTVTVDSGLAVTNILESDSLKKFSNAMLDTLSRLGDGFQRLQAEITYLEKNTLRQREEVVSAYTDSVISEFLPIPKRVVKTIRTNLGKDGSSVAFFDYPAWSNRVFLIICSLLYFYWMYRLGRKSDLSDEELRLHRNEPLWIPSLKSSIFFLVLLPFASFSIPVLVLEFSYFLIFLFLYIILYPELSPFKRKVLGLIFVSYVVLIIANLVQSELWWSRAFSILANFSAIALVWTMGKKTDVDNPVGYIPKYARWAIMLGYLISISMNAFGYIQQARMWSLASAIGLLQAMSLRSFRDMLLHDLENQYERANPETLFRRFDLKRMLKSMDRLIRFCCGALIALVLLNNLQLTREIGSLLERLLTKTHTIGSISYNYADLLLAIAIIWLANWLQKNLKNLIDEPATDELQRRKMTLFPLFRLLIFVVGFLIGFSILGLGMDKLTVIIGALSVGIGLGLQNIINNFVSGIILVFEKPFKVGDYIELADKKGQVLQIGIRSSTLMTDEGARVLIPNGDFLSGRMVNWTFSESDIRVNMLLNVNATVVPIEEIKVALRQKLANFDEVDRDIPIKVHTKEISQENYQLSIQVGVNHVRYIERFRSEFLEGFKKEMDAKEVKVTSI